MAPAFAEDTGGFTVTGGVYGTDYTYEDGKLTILTQTPLTISGTNVSGTVKVGSGVSANLTFDNLSIKVMTPVTLTKTSNLALTLVGANSVVSDFLYPGIEVPFGASLVIRGDGSLEAQGANTSPGIGEGPMKKGWGSIKVESGTVKSAGMNGGAGIGGQGGSRTQALSTGTIEIAGGVVEARGSSLGSAGGAGIGAGSNTTAGGADPFKDDTVSGGNIIISGGKVTASGGAGAAGIGGGSNGDGGSVVLQGGTVDATGGTGAAGIGAGAKNSEDYTTNAGSITIAGGTVTAAGGAGAADIGAGANSTPVPADRVEITGGDVNSGATLDVSVGSGDAAGVVVIGPGAAVPGDTTVTTGYTLTLSLSEAQMTIGQTLRLTAVVTPEKAVVWASEDETLATVDAAGNVKALKEGTVKITASLEGGAKTASCTVTIKAAEVPQPPVTSAPDAAPAGKANPKTGV